MRRIIFVALTVLLACNFAVFSSSLSAQTVDTAIQGTVTDATGAVIPGATVTVTNPANGNTKSVTTGNSGDFNINYLIPGTYDLKATANGFTTNQQRGIVLSIGQQAKISVGLTAGARDTIVEVTTEQPLLQAEDASLGLVVGPERAENLPLNGRKFDDLAILTPGVQVSNPDNHSSSTAGSTVTSNGNQNTWGQAFLDGITMVNNRSAYINAYPSVDAIQEFNVLTGNYSAQYGGGAGAVVNIQLKSGGNQFHGSLFEFIRNDAVDARDFFRPAPLPKTVLKQNQFGGVINGPIFKDKTFFMFSYEGLRSVQQSVSTTAVFTSDPAGHDMRHGDFSAFSKQLVNPYTGLPYPGNIIPSGNCRGCIDPNVQAIINAYMPAPNLAGTTNSTGPVNNYSGVQTGRQSNNQYIIRLDHHLNEKNQLAVHYMYQGRDFPLTGVNPAFSYTGSYIIHHTGMQWVHTFSQNLINEFRGGADLENVKQLPLGFYNSSFTARQIGIQQFTLNGQDLPPSQEGFPTLSVNSFLGFGSGTAASNLDYSRTYQLTDNVTLIKGRHTLLMGLDIRQHSDNATTNNTPFGSMSFNGGYTGASAADFLIGDPTSVTTPEGVPLTLARQWRSGFYMQDNWKPTDKLTVNIGLRYDLFLPPHNLLDSSRTLAQQGGTLVLVPLPNPLWHITHKDFSPRVGFAYSLPWQSVLRGAYAITFYGGKFDNINILQLNPPIDSSFTVANGTGPNNLATFESPTPSQLTAASANVASLPLDGKRPDLYLQTFNLTVSKQFWNNVLDVSYVGVKGTHQDTSIPYWNSGPPQTCANCTAQANRPYPQFGRIRMVDFHGASYFSSLQTKFEHRFSYGLSFSAAYTLAHLMDNQGGDTNGSRSETQIPTVKEWANGLTDQRHYFTTGMVWQPTLHTENRFARQVVNGWMLSSLFYFKTSAPLFVTQSADGEKNDNLFQRPDMNCAVRDLPIPGGQRTLTKWFNTQCFSQANGHYGSTPRNPSSLRGPYQDPVTLGLSRSFVMPYKDSHHLMLRFEMFNALNEPQFGNPGATFGNSTFGSITGTAGGNIGNRQLQLAAKYSF